MTETRENKIKDNRTIVINNSTYKKEMVRMGCLFLIPFFLFLLSILIFYLLILRGRFNWNIITLIMTFIIFGSIFWIFPSVFFSFLRKSPDNFILTPKEIIIDYKGNKIEENEFRQLKYSDIQEVIMRNSDMVIKSTTIQFIRKNGESVYIFKIDKPAGNYLMKSLKSFNINIEIYDSENFLNKNSIMQIITLPENKIQELLINYNSEKYYLLEYRRFLKNYIKISENEIIHTTDNKITFRATWPEILKVEDQDAIFADPWDFSGRPYLIIETKDDYCKIPSGANFKKGSRRILFELLKRYLEKYSDVEINTEGWWGRTIVKKNEKNQIFGSAKNSVEIDGFTGEKKRKKRLEIPKIVGIILIISCIMAVIPLLPTYLMLDDLINIPQNIINIMLIQLVIVGCIVFIIIFLIFLYYKYKGFKIEWIIEK
jgi:hypothetical protein